MTTHVAPIRPPRPPQDRPIPYPEPFYALAVAGTHGWQDEWPVPGSPFFQAAAAVNIKPVQVRGEGFRWTGNLAGVGDGWWSRLRRALGDTQFPDHLDWEASGEAFGYYVGGVGYLRRNVIAHSHGGNVVFYGVADGKHPIRTLVTVGTPVRGDMAAVYAKARPCIGFHLHICDKKWDLWGSLGQAGDAQIRIERTFPEDAAAAPDLQIQLEGIGHTKVLTDPEHIEKWHARGWWDLLRSGAGVGRLPPAGASGGAPAVA
jgi:hypothetical protein